MNKFTQFIHNHRWLFNLKVKWDSLGLWSRLRGKNKVMAFLLRSHKRRVFLRLGQLFVVWQPNRFGVTSNGIRLPNPPKITYMRIIKTTVYDMSLLRPIKVVFDDRPTDVVLDELRAANIENKNKG